MIDVGIDGERVALVRATQPRVTARVLEDGDDGLVLDCDGCVLEIAHGDVIERLRRGADGEEELVLRPTASVIVSTAYVPQRSMVTENMFGVLIARGLMSDNCNCNCNCGGGNCNCNCNCNCTECSVCSRPEMRGFGAIVRTAFRRRA